MQSTFSSNVYCIFAAVVKHTEKSVVKQQDRYKGFVAVFSEFLTSLSVTFASLACTMHVVDVVLQVLAV